MHSDLDPEGLKARSIDTSVFVKLQAGRIMDVLLVYPQIKAKVVSNEGHLMHASVGIWQASES